MFTSLTPFNPREVSNVKNGHANLPKEQPRLFPDCTNFTGPPHPYGCLGCYSPRVQSFNPCAPPNITVGSPGLPRMMVPLPQQPNVFLNFPATCHQVSNFKLIRPRGWGGGVTPYSGLYGEAPPPPKTGNFFPLAEYER